MDIEDIIQNQNKINFVKDLSLKQYLNRDEYDKEFKLLRKKYKCNIKKTDILKIYNDLIQKKIIQQNQSMYEYSMKKIGKSHSGVSVITVLTSPKPKYTNYKGELIEQSFSCGHNCSYCPNEPEIILNLYIQNIINNILFITTNDDINIIRVLNYIEKNNKKFNIIKCFEFKKTSFKIEIDKNDIKYFKIYDKIKGIKIEQPRSYLSTEPAVLRANHNNFDVQKQFEDRSYSLLKCGHSVDKIEIIILGGTWDHYPKEYREEFIRDIYYSANIFSLSEKRNKLSLNDEIKLNEISLNRIIGITTETRPDCINLKTIKHYRKLNITRVQLGVQHIDNDVLEKINRNSSIEDAINATDLLKRNGYKVDWHLMPDLPGSSYDKDYLMFQKILDSNIISNKNNHKIYQLKNPELQSDQLKIYPCTTVDFTDIKKWYDNGDYKPYSENEDLLIKLIISLKIKIFPWIRLNRIIRDIPNINIKGGNENINLRQKILKQMNILNQSCDCIRCREIKNNHINETELFIDEYNGIDSTEYFINISSKDRKYLLGFLRLRINHNNNNLIYNNLIDSGLVRELHVYGLLVKHNDKNNKNNIQHKGIGSLLLKKAEEICIENNIYKISIISGVGVRKYYESKGYHLNNTYMCKNLIKKENNIYNLIFEIILILIILYLLTDIFIQLDLK